MIPMDQCHIDPVYKTIWLNAKAGTEFFTGSTDGMVSNFSYQIVLKNRERKFRSHIFVMLIYK